MLHVLWLAASHFLPHALTHTHTQCFEPYTSNLYVRRTLAGEFVCVSRHLLEDLVALGLW
jgi:hypothetical protein